MIQRLTKLVFRQQWPNDIADLPDDVLLYTPNIVRAGAIIFWIFGLIASVPYIQEHWQEARLVLIRVVIVAISTIATWLSVKYADKYYRVCIIVGTLTGITAVFATVSYMNGMDINPHILLVAVYVMGIGFAIGRGGVILATIWVILNYGFMYMADQLGWWPRPESVSIATIRHENVSALFFTLIILVPLLLGYLSLVQRSLIELKKLAAKQRQNDRALVAELEAERAQIGRDLHDGPMKDGTIAKRLIELCQYLLKSGDIAATLAQLAKIITILDEQAAAMRNIINQLRPIELANHGLEEAIKIQQNRMNPALSISITNEVGSLLDPDIEVLIYYLMREALTNINDHAKARHAWIQIKSDPEYGKLYLEIRDDGCGFDPDKRLPAAEITGHHGLSSMQERVRLLRGELTIESSQDQGTVLHINLPLNAPIGPKTLTLERTAG